jgi:geranylgeranylglycerol-phosphate geranylgeranyltransferase
MNKIKALAKLTRIEHSILLIIAVIAAELIAGGIPAIPIFILSILSPALNSAGAFAINDYFDLETDKANKRTSRPLVSGALKKSTAHNVALVCFVVGTLLSAFIGIYPFIIALVFNLLSYLYSYKLKDMLLVGNVYVALSMAIPFIYGNFVVSNTINPIIILITFVIFLTGLAREIHGMIRDREGDLKIRHSKNLIHYIGVRRSAIFAFTLYIEGIVISFFLFIYKPPFEYNLIYVIPITLVNLILIYIAFGYLTKDNRAFFDLARNLSLAAMGIALLTYLFSAIFYLPI